MTMKRKQSRCSWSRRTMKWWVLLWYRVFWSFILRKICLCKPGTLSQIHFKNYFQDDVSDNIAAYLIVYACDDRVSFDRAVDTLYNLRQKQLKDDVIFFVGNKSDLVRSKCVTTEGKYLFVSISIQNFIVS